MKLNHSICFIALNLLGILSIPGVGHSEEFRKETNHDGVEFSPVSDTEKDYKDRIPSESSQGVMDDPKDLIKDIFVPVKSTNIDGDSGSF